MNPFLSELNRFWDFNEDSLPQLGYWSNLHELRERYSFAVPSDEAIKTISCYSPIVEIGAGLGYWAYLLSRAGCDIIAYDTHPGKGNEWIEKDYPQWYPVKECPIDFVPPADRTLFLCWPPYTSAMATDVLNRYAGDTLIYIGEFRGGCCADDAFFDELEKWDCTESVAIPQLFGIHDSLTIYNRLKK